MKPILCGIETEYGFTVQDRSVSDQTEDSQALVRSYPGKCFLGWDYSQESPRQDLRGWTEKHLTIDPRDAEFDEGRSQLPTEIERADHILPNGARFYNDHGHPEYATPECLSTHELVLHDLAGQEAVLKAAKAFSKKIGKEVKIYKNNTDFHGSSYGCHESYLVPRKFSPDQVASAVIPMLIARQVLAGAGKVGSETKGPVQYQISQRADFMDVTASVDTLFKRPVFNTRDEPHANAQDWIRLHVICGDASLNPSTTAYKVNLIKIALIALQTHQVPTWKIPNPARSFQLVSRDPWGEGRVELENSNWTTPRQILESYFDAVECDADSELKQSISEMRELLEKRFSDSDYFRKHVDWASKLWLIEQFRESESLPWTDSHLQSLDLNYSLLDQDEGLFYALESMGEVQPLPQREEIVKRLERAFEPTRALARGVFSTLPTNEIRTLSWGRVVFADGKTYELPPEREYDLDFVDVESKEDWLRLWKEKE